MEPIDELLHARQTRAYRDAMDEELFEFGLVKVQLTEMDAHRHARSRAICHKCGEGITNGREIAFREEITLCRPCAFGPDHQPQQKLRKDQLYV